MSLELFFPLLNCGFFSNFKNNGLDLGIAGYVINFHLFFIEVKEGQSNNGHFFRHLFNVFTVFADIFTFEIARKHFLKRSFILRLKFGEKGKQKLMGILLIVPLKNGKFMIEGIFELNWENALFLVLDLVQHIY